MADIDIYLERIRSAVYGEEVRSSIHDAISAINEEKMDGVSAAARSASAAESSRQQAVLSEENARAAETNALTSKNAAKTSEDNAKASETSALASKNAAKTSEDTAILAREEAKNSALAASQSELNILRILENVIPYPADLESLFSLLRGYENTEGLRDSSGSEIMDSSGEAINGSLYGFEAFMFTVAMSAARIKELEEEIEKLKGE